jgi:kynurenine formamidase
VKLNITIEGTNYIADLTSPIDISIPLSGDSSNPIAWGLETPQIQPVKMGNWIGKVSEGASVNFNTITFNPHAHGTHTECLGHISSEFYSVNEVLKKYFFTAVVITVTPKQIGKDLVITKDIIENQLNGKISEALIVRTLPNDKSKRTRNYNESDWPFLDEKAALFIKEQGIDHLLIDTPSVDKEDDNGKLLSHKAFWNYPDDPRHYSTITEMIFVPEHVNDGYHILSLQIAPLQNDASSSRPVLYELK